MRPDIPMTNIHLSLFHPSMDCDDDHISQILIDESLIFKCCNLVVRFGAMSSIVRLDYKLIYLPRHPWEWSLIWTTNCSEIPHFYESPDTKYKRSV